MDRSKRKFVLTQSVGVRPGGMLLPQMFPTFHSGGWFPAADVYETDSAIVVFMDISGIEPQTLSVMAEESRLTVSGVRGYEPQEMVSRIHQLEIEHGFFERSIALPRPVDVAKVVSESRNGFLQITLPLRRRTGKIKITVR